MNRLALWFLPWLPLLAVAAPNEIKVFTDELAAYGEHTLETHMNKASRAGPTAQVRATPFQVMPEYSYGIWHNWELSFQLPASLEQDRLSGNGYRGELQYVAPHQENRGWYWGINVEIANAVLNGQQRVWNAEIVPIVGLRIDGWHLVANPGISRALSGSARKINFDPAAKIARKVAGNNSIGLEYYLEAGPIHRLLPNSQRSQVLYVAWDGKLGKSDFNVGLGHGFTGASDRWVIKSVFEFAF